MILPLPRCLQAALGNDDNVGLGQGRARTHALQAGQVRQIAAGLAAPPNSPGWCHWLTNREPSGRTEPRGSSSKVGWSHAASRSRMQPYTLPNRPGSQGRHIAREAAWA